MIPVGSCGAIQEETDIGDLIITSDAVRQKGTSSEYVSEDYPAVADQSRRWPPPNNWATTTTSG